VFVCYFPLTITNFSVYQLAIVPLVETITTDTEIFLLSEMAAPQTFEPPQASSSDLLLLHHILMR
jgi:hypothetical protein